MRRFLLRLIRRRRLENDLELELAHHRAMAAAHDNAIPLGSDLRIKEAVRDLWRVTLVEDAWRDLRLATRSLVRQPGFTIFALIALVVGIGLNGAVFMALNAMALRPWPVRDPGRVVVSDGRSLSLAELRQIRDAHNAFEGVAFSRMGPSRVSMDRREWSAELVSADYFDVLGVPMVLGRPFAALEDRPEAPEAVVVLAHAFWTAQFGADPAVLGRQIRLDDAPFTVVGVAAREFTGGGFPRHMWLPAASRTLLERDGPDWRDDGGCCTFVARLAAGVSRRQAQAEQNVIVSRRPDRSGRPGPGPEPVTLIGTRLIDRPGGWQMLPLFLSAQVVVGAILLLACANVGSLILARAMARDREIAVRVSLGAGRWRIVRQLLAEAILLAVVASLVILLFFLYVSMAPDRWDNDSRVWTLATHVDLRVLAYMAAVALCTTIVCGLAPALQVTRPTLMAAMQRNSAQATPRLPLRSVLLGVQVAISVTVLVCAALLARGAHRAANLDIGFRSAGVSTIWVPQQGADDLVARVRERLQPFGPVGVTSQPAMGSYSHTTVMLPERAANGRETVAVVQVFVDGGYFDALGIPMIAGRSFLPQDRGRDVVLVNETMAGRYWPGESALGRPVRVAVDRPNAAWVWDGTSFRRRADEREHQIIGIVRDAHLTRLGDVEPMLFRVHSESDPPYTLLVPTAVAPIAAETIEDLGGKASVEPFSTRVDAELLSSRLGAQVAIALGILALLLATTGVYGVIAYSVQGRRREIGIRMAVGGSRHAVVRALIEPNARAVLAGLGAGLVLSMLASTVFVSRLYGISRLDPIAYGAVLFLILAAGVAASALPAHRAASIDPIEVLRAD